MSHGRPSRGDGVGRAGSSLRRTRDVGATGDISDGTGDGTIEAGPIATVDTKQGAKVAVYAGALRDGAPCWTFVTAGFATKQHPELVLSLAMRKVEVVERSPTAAVELLGELAAASPSAPGWIRGRA